MRDLCIRSTTGFWMAPAGCRRIETTPEHPFFTDDNEWVAAGELHEGEQIQKADGKYGVVESVKILAEVQLMYNLTVDTAHTFYVGDGHWLVHNSCATTPGGRTMSDHAENHVNERLGGDASIIDDIIDNPTDTHVQGSDGSDVYVQRIGKNLYDYVVANGNHVVTVNSGKTFNELVHFTKTYLWWPGYSR
jgi:hypothetical protein